MKTIYILLCFSFLSICNLAGQIAINKDQLAYAKRNMQQIKNGDRSYKSLISRANKEINNSILPVTHKTIVAASNDPHDYVSMGPYWWADPSKPDGLPYIRRDGERNPETEDMDRDKLARLTQSVSILAYAYHFSGDDKYAYKAVENLKLWFLDDKTRMNANLNYGQIVPGRNDGMGRGTGIIDTYPLIELVDCITILSASHAMKKSDLQGLKQWFSDYTTWLVSSDIGLDEKNSSNNHGTAYDIQVVAYALFSDKKDLAREYIEKFAQERIFKQIEPDGKQPLELERTLALHYSIYNADHMLDMLAFAKSLGIRLDYNIPQGGSSVKKAIDYIVSFLGKEKADFPYQQIKEWDKNQEKICWLMRKASLLKSNKEYDKLFDEYCTTKEQDLNWLLYAK